MKYSANILVVDDDPAILTSARLFLKQKFTYIHTLADPHLMEQVMKETSFDVVLLDMNFAVGESDGSKGLELIERLISMYPTIEVVPISAYGEIDLAVKALKKGARDFITKPWYNDKLLSTITNLLELNEIKNELRSFKKSTLRMLHQPNDPLIGQSTSFKQMIKVVEKVAPTDANVLVLGENGTGKELIARKLHQESQRSDRPFIKVDLGALVESLFESELFGHKKGAFTDASEDRPGKMELANGGTLFLDEIGNISLTQQAKLLSVLEQREVTRVGANNPISLDIRVISATNANLGELVASGRFRSDLLYRINTIEIVVPGLRERSEDLSLLAYYFLEKFKKKYRKPALKLDKEAVSALRAYSWPGNIRELSHCVERSVILTNHSVITPADLGLSVDIGATDDLNLEAMERSLVLKALKKNNGNVTHAARDLGIDRQVLYRRMDKHGI